MNITLDFKDELKRVEKELSSLHQDIIPKAASRAINKTASITKTRAAKMISEEASLKQKEIKRQISIQKATWRSLRGVVKAHGYAPNLIEFVKVSQRKPYYFNQKIGKGKSRKYRKPGVVASPWGKRETYRGTFIGKGKNSGKLLVFARTGPAYNAKLKAIYGPSVVNTFKHQQVLDAMYATVGSEFPKYFDHEIRCYLNRKFNK